MAAAASSAVLALEDKAYGKSSGWRKNEDLIDALPYFDSMVPELKQQVDSMIEEELKRSTKKPSDYLREMPPLHATAFEGHPILAAEYERVKSKAPMAPLDTTRYRLDKPAGGKQHDFGAWKASVDNAHSQLEHQYLRITNLELLLKYGDKNWRAQGQLVDSLVKHYETELAETKKQITAVNMERKLQQTAAGGELRKAEAEYFQLLHKNIDIEMACDRLEHAVMSLQSKADAAAGKGQQQQMQVEVAAGEGPQQQMQVEVAAGEGPQQQQVEAAAGEGQQQQQQMEVETAAGKDQQSDAPAIAP